MRYLLLLLALLLGCGAESALAGQVASPIVSISIGELPQEARTTLRLIQRGGPFPYRRDGVVFGNYEQRLPKKPRGSYREYTVPTPGGAGRGARRIIAGESGELYYSDDHYQSFRRIRE